MPASPSTWTRKVCVYRAHGPTDGHIVRDLLVADGIPVEMRGEQLTSLAGGIPLPDAWPTLWVIPHNAPRARSLIDSMDAGTAMADWTCACGEDNDGSFGSCWSCSRDRPDLMSGLGG